MIQKIPKAPLVKTTVAMFCTFEGHARNATTSTTGRSSSNLFTNNNAEKVFQQFSIGSPSEQTSKSYFDMSYSNMSSTIDCPYQVLGLKKGACPETIKLAYRQLALEYHPETNNTAEAAKRFVEITKAFQKLVDNNQSGTKSEVTTFMHEFDNSLKRFMLAEAGVTTQEKAPQVKIAELYSESKKVKKFGNKKQVRIEREYNRDGNLMKITRVQTFHEDGTAEITETYDDGVDVKTKKIQAGPAQAAILA